MGDTTKLAVAYRMGDFQATGSNQLVREQHRSLHSAVNCKKELIVKVWVSANRMTDYLMVEGWDLGDKGKEMSESKRM